MAENTTQGYTQPDYNQFLNMDSHQQPNYATLTSQSHKQPISGNLSSKFFQKWKFQKLNFYIFYVSVGIF